MLKRLRHRVRDKFNSAGGVQRPVGNDDLPAPGVLGLGVQTRPGADDLAPRLTAAGTLLRNSREDKVCASLGVRNRNPVSTLLCRRTAAHRQKADMALCNMP